MQHYTRLEERPSLVTIAMLEVNPRTNVTVIPLGERYGAYVCADDNPVFVANVIVFAHAHDVRLDIKDSHIWCDGA